jgi:hypothetical protein
MMEEFIWQTKIRTFASDVKEDFASKFINMTLVQYLWTVLYL